jgi:hypothetical protein
MHPGQRPQARASCSIWYDGTLPFTDCGLVNLGCALAQGSRRATERWTCQGSACTGESDAVCMGRYQYGGGESTVLESGVLCGPPCHGCTQPSPMPLGCTAPGLSLSPCCVHGGMWLRTELLLLCCPRWFHHRAWAPVLRPP